MARKLNKTKGTMAKRVMVFLLAYALSGCGDKTYQLAPQAHRLLILNAYGLDYMIDKEIGQAIKLPEIKKGESLLSYASLLLKHYKRTYPAQQIDVQINWKQNTLKVTSCADECVSIQSEFSVASYNTMRLDCSSKLSSSDDSIIIYSKLALAEQETHICGVSFNN